MKIYVMKMQQHVLNSTTSNSNDDGTTTTIRIGFGCVKKRQYFAGNVFSVVQLSDVVVGGHTK